MSTEAKIVEKIDEAVKAALFVGDLDFKGVDEFKVYALIAQKLAFHAGDFIGMATQDAKAAEKPLAKATAIMRKQALVYSE